MSSRKGATSASPAASSPALEAAAGEWILLVNDDAELEPGAAVALLGATGSAEVGSTCGQVRFHARRDTINTAGLVIDRLGRRL